MELGCRSSWTTRTRGLRNKSCAHAHKCVSTVFLIPFSRLALYPLSSLRPWCPCIHFLFVQELVSIACNQECWLIQYLPYIGKKIFSSLRAISSSSKALYILSKKKCKLGGRSLSCFQDESDVFKGTLHCIHRFKVTILDSPTKLKKTRELKIVPIY